jgi:hypothetical protein
MPRPRASPDIKALALDFACVVTTDEGADGSSFVARHGTHSIYAVLTRCCIGAIRDHTPETNRKGISEAEFLRTLAERAMPVHNREFLRFRYRKAVKMSDDPTGAGVCMFRNVRWRSPANPTDLKYLREQHQRLSKKYPSCRVDPPRVLVGNVDRGDLCVAREEPATDRAPVAAKLRRQVHCVHVARFAGIASVAPA